MLPQTVRVIVGDTINIAPEPGWLPPTLKGTALQQMGMRYVAMHVGRAVLEARNGVDRWKLTVVVINQP
jgi:hypothetical protein